MANPPKRTVSAKQSKPAPAAHGEKPVAEAKETKPVARKRAILPKASRTAPPVDTVSAIDARPTEDAIAMRAYELFLRRGATHGYDWQDWLMAERELANGDAAPGSTRAA